MIFVIGLAAILTIAAIGGWATRGRGKGFYPQGTSDDPLSINEGLTRGRLQDDTFNRKYR